MANSSPFKHVTLSLEIHLPPCYWKDINSGIEYKLNKFLMKHIEEVGGVMLAYWNVQYLQEKGRILNDTPHIHFPISFEVLLFTATPGTKLIGKVNKVGEDHIGLLVYGIFNASISEASLREQYTKTESGWLSKSTQENLKEEQLIEFTVTGSARSKEIVAITGTLNKPKSENKKRKTSDIPQQNQLEDQPSAKKKKGEDKFISESKQVKPKTPLKVESESKPKTPSKVESESKQVKSKTPSKVESESKKNKNTFKSRE